jgi:flagellar hook-associated protein 1 FlgK
MLGLFGTLNLASQSMQTQMTAIEVTGQNIANVNTPGYSRQTANITTSPDVQSGIGPEGTGSTVTSIDQVVSQLLNSQIQSQSSTSGYWSAQQSALQSAQDAVDEYLSGSSTSSTSSTTDSSAASSSGLSSLLSNFFSAFSSLATSNSASNQQAAVSAAQNLASSFNNADTALSSVRGSLNDSLTSDVSSANQLLTNIASLNQEINNAEADGGNANDLRDEREQDLENLSGLTTISTSTSNNGAVNVTIGGQALVSGYTVNDTLQTYDAGSGQLLVETASGGVPLTLTGGSIQGTIDARDNTLATVQSNLNTLANTVITQVNNILDNGYNSTGGTGNTFFTGSDASSIAVNASLVNNPSLLQIAGSSTSTGDTSLALQVSDLSSTAQSALNDQTFSGSYDGTITDLGTALDDANTEVTDQTTVSNMLSTQRSSVSGVDLDQEMTNMLTYQQAYQASAEVVTTLNTLLGDTMNMMAA